MLVPILVATPHAAFGELLRISLEDSGQYQVRLVMSGREVRALAGKSSFQLAILDSALADEPFNPLCSDLLEIQKGIRLIVIPPDNNPNHPSLGGLLPHSYLNRPFYLPDMLDTVSRVLNQSSAKQEEPIPEDVSQPSWLQDRQPLLRLLETELASAQAIEGIIGLHGDGPGSGALRCHTGRLPEAAANEVANVVFRYWNRDEKTDLMRFIRLSSDNKDYLIYATQLEKELVLILVFDSAAPLSQIRPQTKKIAQTLASIMAAESAAIRDHTPPAPDIPADVPEPLTESGHTDIPALSSIIESEEFTATDEQELTQPDIWEHPPEDESSFEYPWQTGDSSSQASSSQTRFPAKSYEGSKQEPIHMEKENQEGEEKDFPPVLNHTIPLFDSDEMDFSGIGPREEIINLSALLGSVPSPDPGNDTSNGDWSTEASLFFPTAKNQDAENNLHSKNKLKTDGQADEKTLEDHNAPTTPLVLRSVSKTPTFDLNLAVEEEIDSLEDTRPHIVAALTNLSQLEPVSAALSQLNYTCVLIPRLPQHYLTGDLAEQLAQWVQQLCLAFGWRLEGIAIRPEYLQWTVQVSPSISPGNMIRIVRQRTSLNIFDQFTHYREQNPSGDFWANGYLIVSGVQPPSAQLLRDYITQTRRRQGIIK